ncbi:MAG: VOC family protein [Actinomycetota bacterium]
MDIELGQEAIDIGLVVSDGEKALAFYRDLLGMDHEADTPMPLGGGGTMHRVRCGTALLKIVAFNDPPTTPSPPGGIPGALGVRYITIHAQNLEEIMAGCEEAGVPIVVPVSEIRPGTTIGMVNDPDGNIVEFVRYPDS